VPQGAPQKKRREWANACGGDGQVWGGSGGSRCTDTDVCAGSGSDDHDVRQLPYSLGLGEGSATFTNSLPHHPFASRTHGYLSTRKPLSPDPRQPVRYEQRREPLPYTMMEGEHRPSRSHVRPETPHSPGGGGENHGCVKLGSGAKPQCQQLSGRASRPRAAGQQKEGRQWTYA